MEKARDERKAAEANRESLTTVVEERKVPTSILTPVVGPDQWVEGQRYLMAPAIMAICPTEVFTLFDGNDSHNSHFFGKIVLGRAAVAQIVSKGLDKEEYKWSTGAFVLRQNYLLEYSDGDDSNSRPQGFAFLQNATVLRHDVDALRLDYYQNQNSSSRKSVSVSLPLIFHRTASQGCTSRSNELL